MKFNEQKILVCTTSKIHMIYIKKKITYKKKCTYDIKI